MHYYQFNIGDYARRTKYLDLMEDLAYRRLLDLYYLNEQPFDPGVVVSEHARAIGMRSHCDEVAFVLEKYFPDGVNKHADDEIAKYRSKSAKAKASAEARWNKGSMRSHTDRNANQEPRTNNQEPIKSKEKAKRFIPPTLQDVINRCHEMGYNNIDPESFFNFYESKNWYVGKNKMKKWEAALANWNTRNKNEKSESDKSKRYTTKEILGDINDTNW